MSDDYVGLHQAMLAPSAAGELIRRQLAEIGWTQTRLARATDITTKHLSFLMLGKSQITPVMALRIEAATGLSAQALIVVDARDRLARARRGERTP